MNGEMDQISKILNQLKERFNTKNKSFFTVIVLIIVVLWILFTGLFTVAVDEVAVIQRFGRYVRQRGPGLHFKLPDGIEKRTNVKVKKVYTAEFGLRTIKADITTKYAPEEQYLIESLMLTGDLNCALVPWIVQFRISDPVKFLFKVRDPESTLRDLSEAIMRQVVGDRSINEVITKRLEIADKANVDLQKVLDEAETGFAIVNIELKNTNVPGPVQPSFNEVNQALQEKEKTIYQAREEYNKAIPAEKGEAERIIRAAEGYALDRINTAKGDSSLFVAQHAAYAKSKNVTRRRMYLETMEEILPKLGGKYIIDGDQRSILPLLNIGGKGEQK